MRWVYVLLTWCAGLVLVPLLALMKKTRSGQRERLGFIDASKVLVAGRTEFGDVPKSLKPRIWLHGASAGDLLALAPMIDRLRKKYPQSYIMVSTITNTGYLMATERLRSQIDLVIYAPYDFFFSTRRVVAVLKPDLLVLEYTEVWPNLIRAAKRSGAKVVITNGRFSKKNLHRYRLFFALIGNPLCDLDVLMMREEEEAERALKLGATSSQVRVTGNTKFDALAPLSEAPVDLELQRALGIVNERVWIAGSTHEGEESILLQVFRRLKVVAPDLKLVLAPRYIERAARVVGLVKAAQFSVSLRSQHESKRSEVVVLDSIGELPRAYKLATLVFVGGSFIPRGGQNILEPAAQGKPVLFGPRMENFRDSVQVLVGRGGIQVNDAEHLFRVMSDLLTRPKSLAGLGVMAKATVHQVKGASDRNVEIMSQILEA
jgi:3-deoxy-D-manno-octulosonic-acid transferase